MNKEDFEYAKRFEDWLKGKNLNGIQEDVLKLRIENENLRKENAELKETLKTYNGCGDWDNDFHTCRVYLQHEELQKYIYQLNEAKEIIDNFLDFESSCQERGIYISDEMREKANKFLEEE